MAEIATIARPYAEAAFRLAREKKALGAWSQALAQLAQVAEQATAASVIGNPNVAAAKVEDLFRSVTGDDAELANLVHLLSTNIRLTCLPEISAQFDAMKRSEEGVKQGVVYSAFPLDDAQVSNLKTMLEGRFGRLELSVAVTPELIGGVKVVVGDQVLDTSVSGKLVAMRAALNS
jgi:F-type H+-transporting ATPase subunit delta